MFMNFSRSPKYKYTLFYGKHSVLDSQILIWIAGCTPLGPGHFNGFLDCRTMSSLRVLTPTGTLGYGFGQAALERGLAIGPDVIAVDAGSTDPGPHYLGSGETLVSRISIKRELKDLIIAARKRNIPLVVGSAGGAGASKHVDQTVAIVREIARENALSFKLAYIYADIPIDRAKQALAAGEIDRFEASFDLTEELLDQTTTLVAQMGYEPIAEALREGADVVIAGRSCDDCAIAAYGISQGFDPANAIHMGKILECGAFSAQPFAMDVMIGTLDGSSFILEPGSLDRRASVMSVAAHSLYEREDPFHQGGPGHILDLSGCTFEQIDDRRVCVRGATMSHGSDYWVKLEGARRVGYRTICVAGVRCPTMVARLDGLLKQVREETLQYFSDPSLDIIFHRYGQNGVMGRMEPQRNPAHEIGLVIETVAAEQELARAACHHASGALLHLNYPGQYNTSGNLAFLYSPSEIDAGPAYAFSAYHLMKAKSPTELFPIHFEAL
jgi:hypothetical protein